MTHTEDLPDVDLRRLPYEIERATGFPYIPPMYSRFDPDGVAILAKEDGPELGKIPYYRMRSVSMAALVALVKGYLPNVAEQDQVLAALRDGKVTAPPDGDLVIIQVFDEMRLVLHRGRVVPDWPEEEIPEL